MGRASEAVETGPLVFLTRGSLLRPLVHLWLFGLRHSRFFGLELIRAVSNAIVSAILVLSIYHSEHRRIFGLLGREFREQATRKIDGEPLATKAFPT